MICSIVILLLILNKKQERQDVWKNYSLYYHNVFHCSPKHCPVYVFKFWVRHNLTKIWFESIDSETKETNDLTLVCWNCGHLLYSMVLAFPSIIIWGFGILLFAWIVLARNKEEIDNIEVREKYRFLCNGYKKEYYFWESISM